MDKDHLSPDISWDEISMFLFPFLVSRLINLKKSDFVMYPIVISARYRTKKLI